MWSPRGESRCDGIESLRLLSEWSGKMTRNSLLTFVLNVIVLSGCALACSRTATAAGNAGRIHWKMLPDAQLKLDDKPPLTWNVYQPEKKKNSPLILVLLGRRYLFLDYKAKLVYAVLPSDLQSQGNDFESDDLAIPDHLIPSTEWSVRDVGPAEQIRLTLGDYGRVLEVSLAHMPDLRPFY